MAVDRRRVVRVALLMVALSLLVVLLLATVRRWQIVVLVMAAGLPAMALALRVVDTPERRRARIELSIERERLRAEKQLEPLDDEQIVALLRDDDYLNGAGMGPTAKLIFELLAERRFTELDERWDKLGASLVRDELERGLQGGLPRFLHHGLRIAVAVKLLAARERARG